MKLSISTIRAVAHPCLALAVAVPLLAQAKVPLVESKGVGAIVTCQIALDGGSIKAVHMDKIIFRVTGALVAVLLADQPALDAVPKNSRLDIKVLDNPAAVADLKGKVLTFLGAVDNVVNRDAISIDDVDYAVVCPTVPAAVPVGG